MTTIGLEAFSERENIRNMLRDLENNITSDSFFRDLLFVFDEWKERNFSEEYLYPAFDDFFVTAILNLLLKYSNDIRTKNVDELPFDAISALDLTSRLIDVSYLSMHLDIGNNQLISCLMLYFIASEECKPFVMRIYALILDSIPSCPSVFFSENTIRELSQGQPNENTGKLACLLIKRMGNLITAAIQYLIYNWMLNQFYTEEFIIENICWSLKAINRLIKLGTPEIKLDSINEIIDIAREYNNEKINANILSIMRNILLDDNQKYFVISNLTNKEYINVKRALKCLKNTDNFILEDYFNDLIKVISSGVVKNKLAALMILKDKDIPKEYFTTDFLNTLLMLIDYEEFRSCIIGIVRNFFNNVFSEISLEQQSDFLSLISDQYDILSNLWLSKEEDQNFVEGLIELIIN